MGKALLKRLFTAILIALWLILMAFPIVAFVLATQGEIQIGSGHRSNLRIFLVQGTESKGVGLQWSRSVSGPGDCLRTSLRYVLWEGSNRAQNNSYCVCYSPGQDEHIVDCP